jgi:RNA polymerase sigma-70 factor (family 1)
VTSSVAANEREWVRGLLQHREDVFRTIYDAYQRPIFSFAFYLTKSKDTAEEVTQEVFIRLWEKRTHLNTDTYLLAYLKKMTQNLVMDIFRKASRDKILQDRIYNNMVSAATGPTPEAYFPDKLLEKELAHIYQEALDRLSPQQRVVLALRRDENLSYEQIAQKLGLAKNTVRNHLNIAMHSVRSYVSQNAELGALAIAIFLDKHPH